MEAGARASFMAAPLLAAGIMLAQPASADSVELMAGNKNTTLDLKASAEIAKRLGFFMRARPSLDYSGKLTSFGLADLTINLVGGLDAVAEVQASAGDVVPRMGAQYFISTGSFSFYTLATVGLDSSPYLESVTTISYVPELYQNLKLLSQLENITDARPREHVFSVQRLRLGIEWKGWGVGPAADLEETGNRPNHRDGTLDWNVGGFVSKKF